MRMSPAEAHKEAYRHVYNVKREGLGLPSKESHYMSMSTYYRRERFREELRNRTSNKEVK